MERKTEWYDISTWTYIVVSITVTLAFLEWESAGVGIGTICDELLVQLATLFLWLASPIATNPSVNNTPNNKKCGKWRDLHGKYFFDSVELQM